MCVCVFVCVCVCVFRLLMVAGGRELAMVGVDGFQATMLKKLTMVSAVY